MKSVKKSEIFSVSAVCPRCGTNKHMRISDNPDYAYQCLECGEDFFAMECVRTVGNGVGPNGKIQELWNLSVHDVTEEWFNKNNADISKKAKAYGAVYVGFDSVVSCVDIGWSEPPCADFIQRLSDDIMDLLDDVVSAFQTYYVTYKVDGRYVAKVRAASVDDAKKLAETAYCNADFGEATDIDGQPIIIENDSGEYVWEKE